MVVIVVVFKSVRIIDSHQCAGEGSDLSEGDQQGFMDLSGGFYIDSAEEKYESTDSKDGGGDELYVSVFIHRLFFGGPQRALLEWGERRARRSVIGAARQRLTRALA